MENWFNCCLIFTSFVKIRERVSRAFLKLFLFKLKTDKFSQFFKMSNVEYLNAKLIHIVWKSNWLKNTIEKNKFRTKKLITRNFKKKMIKNVFKNF